jgi:hypothetical protein
MGHSCHEYMGTRISRCFGMDGVRVLDSESDDYDTLSVTDVRFLAVALDDDDDFPENPSLVGAVCGEV